MFDGDGMITAITFQDGKAIFRNRFVRTVGYVRETKFKRILYRGSFGTRKRGLLANLFDTNFKNTANTNVIYWDKKLLALQESGLPHFLEPDSLHTLGQYTFRGALRKSRDALTAHPRVDVNTGRLVTFTTKKGNPSAVTVREFDSNSEQVSSR